MRPTPAEPVAPISSVSYSFAPTAAVCLTVLGAIAAAVHAQSQAPPVFRAEANLVEVIVRVTDAKGQFIPDLTQADFALEEEGRAQAIVAFHRVDVRQPAAS